MVNYYTLKISEAIKSLGSSEKGLTEEEAKQRLEKYGINEIEKRKRITPLHIFLRQFTSFIVIILLAAIVISLLVGERLDAVVISIILILNGIFGFVQEYKAEKAIEALRKLTALKAKVIRNGKEIEIDSIELVPVPATNPPGEIPVTAPVKLTVDVLTWIGNTPPLPS